jgi:hypothetical protein
MFDPNAAFFMLGCVARLSMAAIFLLAALHAMRDWPAYSATVINYRVAPGRVALFASWVLPVLQLATAILLLAWAAAGAILGLALLAVFTAAIAINLRRGRMEIDCGCGGADGQQISRGLLVRNAVLMLVLLPAGTAPATGQLGAAFCIGTVGSLIFLVGTYFTANQLLTNAQRLQRSAA